MKSKIKIKGIITAVWLDNETGEVKRFEEVENLVTFAGIEAMFQRMTQEYASDLHINYVALGTGTNVATTGDTSLQTESYRNEVASVVAEDNVLYADAYFTASEVDGSFKEFGFFIDGTGASDSGVLWNRVIVDWVKSDTESLYISGKWTLTNS